MKIHNISKSETVDTVTGDPMNAGDAVPEADPGPNKPKKAWRSFLKDIVSFCFTMCVVLIICHCVLAFHIVPSGSMEPTIRTNSFAVCWRLPYLIGDKAPSYGDIVSFKREGSDKILIKRVIGLPGDTITITDGYVYRNGVKLEEPYVAEQGMTVAKIQDSYVVPEGHFFVLGDNREHSSDSRAMKDPFIAFEDIYAKMIFAFQI